MSVFDDYWTNAAGGDYGTAGNWLDGVPNPDNASEVAVLGQVGASTADYTVLTQGGVDAPDLLGQLQISFYATLEFAAGDYIAADRAAVSNAGRIEALGDGSGPAPLDVLFAGTFSNSGTVDFVGDATPNFYDGSSLNLDGAVTNTGLIESNGAGGLLSFQGGSLTNQGQVLAEGNGTYQNTTEDVIAFRNETIDNAGGVIGSTLTGNVAIASGVDLSGGTLTGTIYYDAVTAASVLDGVTISSGSILIVSGDSVDDGIKGVITNKSEILVGNEFGENSELAIDGKVTLLEGGYLVLERNGDSEIVSSAGASELYNKNNIIGGSGQIESANGGTLTLINGRAGRIESGIGGRIGRASAGPYKYAEASDLDIDTGQMVTNQGVIETGVNSTMTIKDAIDNTGHIAANWASLLISGAVTGAGLDSINRTELTFDQSVSSGQEVLFHNNARLELGDASEFQGVLTGFGADDKIFLDGFDSHKVQPLSWAPNAGGGVLTVSDGSHTAELDFAGSYTAGSFKIGGSSTQAVLTFV